MSEQVLISAFEFARREQSLRGKVAFAEFLRLKSRLESSSGEAEYTLTGELNSDGKPTIVLRINGELVSSCQRCFKPLVFRIDISKVFVLISDASEFLPLEEEGEEVETIVGSSKMNVQDLIEDELLLSIPISLAHPNCDNAYLSMMKATSSRQGLAKTSQNKH